MKRFGEFLKTTALGYWGLGVKDLLGKGAETPGPANAASKEAL